LGVALPASFSFDKSLSKNKVDSDCFFLGLCVCCFFFFSPGLVLCCPQFFCFFPSASLLGLGASALVSLVICNVSLLFWQAPRPCVLNPSPTTIAPCGASGLFWTPFAFPVFSSSIMKDCGYWSAFCSLVFFFFYTLLICCIRSGDCVACGPFRAQMGFSCGPFFPLSFFTILLLSVGHSALSVARFSRFSSSPAIMVWPFGHAGPICLLSKSWTSFFFSTFRDRP